VKGRGVVPNAQLGARGIRGAVLRQRRLIMSRRRASDEALARWFSFQPAAEPLNGEAALEPAAAMLEADVSLSAL